jgi:NADH-quinone oxidoreductase subunit I
VDCIYIKAEKRPATAPAIWAADGTPIKLDTRVFDIDMSLCCYCNLCTYPCPTNCIYMTPEYEFAATDLTQHLYHFAKPNAKFLTVNPKPPAPKPAVAAAAPGAPTPVAPSPGTAPKPAPPPEGTPANPAPNVATGTPPTAGGDPSPDPEPEPSKA